MVFQTIVDRVGKQIERDPTNRENWEELYRGWSRGQMLPNNITRETSNDMLYSIVQEDPKFAGMLLELNDLEMSDDVQVYKFWQAMDRVKMIDGKPHDKLTNLPIHAKLDGIEMHLVPTGTYQLEKTKLVSDRRTMDCLMAMPEEHPEIVYLSQPVLESMFGHKGTNPIEVTFEEAQRYASVQNARLPTFEVLDIALNSLGYVSVMSPIGTLANLGVGEWTTEKDRERIVTCRLDKNDGRITDRVAYVQPEEKRNFRLMKGLGLKGEVPFYSMGDLVVAMSE